jgi:hypothetical protein
LNIPPQDHQRNKASHHGPFYNTRGKTDEKGNTVLHLAAEYIPNSSEEDLKAQLNVVKRVLWWFPDALTRLNGNRHSVYQHRMSTCKQAQDAAIDDSSNREGTLHPDIVTEFLKYGIMHLCDRADAIRLLRGGYGADNSPGK